VWGLPLGVHAAALGLLLLVAMLLTVPDQLGNADEGAALSQTQLLIDGDGWSMPHPLPAADPDGVAFPIHNSDHIVGTDEHVPFSKHPTYPVLLMPFVAGFGVAGGQVVSVLGTVAAAVAAALIARRFDDAIARPTLWFLGVATPLWFDSFVTIAHTVGAALVGFAVLLLMPSRVGVRALAGAAVLLTLAVLFRTEALLLGVALAIVLGARALLDRDRRGLVVAAGAFGAVAVGHVLDGLLASWALGGASVDQVAVSESTSFVQGRIDALSLTVLWGSDRTTIGSLLSTLGLALVVAAAVTARRRPADTGGILVFLGGALACEALRWWIEPNAHVPGLAVATPLLVGGLLLLDRETLVRREVSMLVATFALFFVAVAATQYSNGGGGGWGGRYFAIGLPIIVPVAALAIRRTGLDLASGARRPALAMGAAIGLVLAVSASSSLLVDHRLTREFEDTVASVTADLDAGDGDPRPVVVSTRPALGRLAFRLVLDDQRWIGMSSTDEDVVPFLERLHDLGVERLVLVTSEPDETMAAISSRYEVVTSHSVTADDPRGREVVWSSEVLVLAAVNPS
jgi:hypothetical protein